MDILADSILVSRKNLVDLIDGASLSVLARPQVLLILTVHLIGEGLMRSHLSPALSRSSPRLSRFLLVSVGTCTLFLDQSVEFLAELGNERLEKL